MIKTFKAGNEKAANTGLIEVQPTVVDDIPGKSGKTAKGKSKIPHDTPIGVPTGAQNVQDKGLVDMVGSPSLGGMSNKLGKPGYLVDTGSGKGKNAIIPIFDLFPDPGVSLPSSSDELSVSTKKFDAYEHLTGISKERPEIIMLTNFQPLFNEQSFSDHPGAKLAVNSVQHLQTDAGAFFDHQASVRKLKQHNANQLMSSLKQNSHIIKQEFSLRKENFSNRIGELTATSHYLWGLIKTLEKLKHQLDLRDDVHEVDPQESLRNHVGNFGPVRSDGLLRGLTTSVNSNFPPKFNVVDVMGLFGYTKVNTRTVYTSSKLWLQMMFEFKNLLRTHSLNLLDIEPTYQKRDDSPAKITQTPGVKRFDFAAFLPNIPAMSDIKDIQPNDIPGMLSLITDAYNVIYENVQFKNDETRIAALLNAVSREFRYSRGISNPDVQNTLESYYGYNIVNNNNLKLMDVVIGQFGNNITDIPAVKSSALTSIAQFQPAENVAVMTLESKYIEGDNGIITPGSSYFIDYVLEVDGDKFATNRMIQLQEYFDKAYKQFNVFVNGMNLLAAEYTDDQDANAGTFEISLNNPRSLFNELRKNIVTDSGFEHVDVKKDVLVPVFAAAKNNQKIKSLMVMYFIAKMSKSYGSNVVKFFKSSKQQDNTAATDAIIDQIIAELLKEATAISNVDSLNKFKNGQTGEKHGKVLVNVATIKNAFKTNTRLLTVIEGHFSQIAAAFRSGNLALNGNVTRYGGHPDTVIMMALMDVIATMMDLYGNRKISGKVIDKTGTSFSINEKTQNHAASINEVDHRLSKEIVLTQHVIFTVLNTLKRLSNSIGNVVNYLNSPQSLKELKKIVELIDDPKLLHMLFSEQQIRLFASSVADLSHALREASTASSVLDDVNGDGKFDADDEIRALDDSSVSTRVKEAIDALFSLSEYSSAMANNKKILTVGIPLGFGQHLQRKVDVRRLKKSSFDDKQNDIIKINVYKVDLQNPDIVYLPRSYFFELSRFPVRSESLVKNIVAKDKMNIINRFPTRDYSGIFAEGGSLVQYYNAAPDESEALSSDEYSFLPQNSKMQLYMNHVMSYLLEVYIRVMTGISTSDYHFDLIDPPPNTEEDFVNLIVNHHLGEVTSKRGPKETNDENVHQGGSLFTSTHKGSNSRGGRGMNHSDGTEATQGAHGNSSGTPGMSIMSAMSNFTGDTVDDISPLARQKPRTTDDLLSSVSTKDVPLLQHTFGVINEFARTPTPLSDPLSVSKRLINPKQFDRIFNLLVDPNDFEIDVNATMATPHGKQAFELLVRHGEILPQMTQSSLFMGSNKTSNAYSARKKSPAAGDLSFEKFLVSIETIGEDTVLCRHHYLQKRSLL